MHKYSRILKCSILEQVKSKLLGMKCVFRHQDLQMFGPKLDKAQ